MKKLWLLSAALLLSACSEQVPLAAGAGGIGASPNAAGETASPGMGFAASGRAVAAAPDKGRLAAYPVAPSIDKGGERWRPVALSEAHALGAVGQGRQLVFESPDGVAHRFTYLRHAEHPSGSWTWVGRANDDGRGEAVITFGERAVFGSIDRGGGRLPLKLTTSGGRTWLIEESGWQGPLAPTRRGGTDAPIPPRFAKPSAMPSIARNQLATATAVPVVVDVLIGYTTGLAASLGGDSQAQTRVAFLVELANQAHLNAQSGAQLRLVHAMPVSYPDATSNDEALDKLTGSSGSGPGFPADPAFAALRAARETYGADLVSLVRKFQTPQNDGCGIAWLIGGDLSPIVPEEDDYFGYSVVSDGTDVDEDDSKTYFCRQETLAHELGHNKGLAHDIANSSSPGAYPYAYGYKTGAAGGNFYTVMAYGSSGQTAYRTFSNPAITFCGGFACGLVDQADNARALRQTAPLIARFRPTKVAGGRGSVRNDVDGDGKSDLIHASGTLFSYWLLDGPALRQATLVGGAGGDFVMGHTGDFTGDRRADFVYRNPQGVMWLWTLGPDNFTVTARAIGGAPAGWQLFATDDVDGDGKADLLFRNGGSVSLWKMDGPTVASGMLLGTAAAGYIPVGSGDMNGDGRADIVFRAPSTRRLLVWYVNADWTVNALESVRTPEGWTLFSIDDQDGDGKADLFLRNGTQLAYWLMDGATLRSTVVVGGAGGNYVATRTGDYDGDGRADVIYQDDATRDMWLWRFPAGGGLLIHQIGGIESGWTTLNWPGVLIN